MELFDNFRKARDNVINTFVEKFIVFLVFLYSIRNQIIEIVALLKNLLSKGAKKEVGLV